MKVEITPRGNNCFRIKIFEEELTHNTNIKPYIQPLLKTPIESNISYETQRSGGWVLVHGTAKLGLTRNEIKFPLW